jgi:2-oxoisovalerate dehydrogenase E2 component (dihydrolipoyl transacylase)
MPNTVVQMPQLGESVAEGTIGRWLKQPGERVERDEPLVEVQTDKVNAEVPSPVAGVLQKVLLPEGATVAVKTEIAIIGDEPVPEATGADGGPSPAAAAERPPAATAPPPVAASETPAAPERGAAVPVEAPSFRYDAGAAGGGPTSSALAGAQATPPDRAGAPAGAASADRAAAPAQPAASAPGATEGKRFYTPVVLRLAREHGIDLETIVGSGLGGRVTRRDVELAIAGHPPAVSAGTPEAATAAAAPADGAAVAAGAVPAPPAPAPPGPTAPAPAAPAVAPAVAGPAVAEAESRALTPMRRAIAEHMRRARAEIPDAWAMVEIDVTRLVRQRAALLADWQAREGFELTYLPFFIKAVLAGLRAVPELNASWAGDHITLHHHYDLGIAVSLDQGLVVPALRNADQLSVAGLARALRALVQKARSGKLTADDLSGVTFTVNNPGALGSILSQPVVPLGQAGIVTMEAITKRPVVTADDALAVRSMMNACLSFDHRILDGAQALRFLRTLKDQLETVEYPLY